MNSSPSVPRHAVLKSRSTISGHKYEKSTRKVTRSNGEVPQRFTKKRGIYVEQSVGHTPVTTKSKRSSNPRVAPPPPRPKSGSFMCSALLILDKSTTATQYPEVSTDDKHKTPNEPKSKHGNTPSKSKLNEAGNSNLRTYRGYKPKRNLNSANTAYLENKKESTMPKKFRSSILRGIYSNGNKSDGDDEKRSIHILQDKKSFVQTPSMYSQQSILPIQSDAADNYASYSQNGLKPFLRCARSSNANRAVFDSKEGTMEQSIEREESEITYEKYNDDFSEYINPNVSVYNVNTPLQENKESEYKFDEPKLTINEVIEENNIDEIDPRLYTEGYDFSEHYKIQQDLYRNDRYDDKHFYNDTFDNQEEALHPIYDEFYEHDEIRPVRRRKVKARKSFNDNLRTKAKLIDAKNKLISMFKEKLSEPVPYEEPTNLFQALRQMSKNKTKIQEKRLSFIEPEPKRRRRKKSILTKPRKRYDYDTRKIKLQNNLMSEESGSEVNVAIDSYHSLMVYDMDVESNAVYDEKARNIALYPVDRNIAWTSEEMTD